MRLPGIDLTQMRTTLAHSIVFITKLEAIILKVSLYDYFDTHSVSQPGLYKFQREFPNTYVSRIEIIALNQLLFVEDLIAKVVLLYEWGKPM